MVKKKGLNFRVQFKQTGQNFAMGKSFNFYMTMESSKVLMAWNRKEFVACKKYSTVSMDICLHTSACL